MPGFLVRGGSVLVFVDLDEYEVGRIGAITEHIESHNSRLVTTRTRVLLSRGQETLKHIGNDRNINMDNQQAVRHVMTLSGVWGEAGMHVIMMRCIADELVACALRCDRIRGSQTEIAQMRGDLIGGRRTVSLSEASQECAVEAIFLSADHLDRIGRE